jgi:hypothetical protein
VRSWDDSLVVKNYPRGENHNVQGSTENILFENCIVWTDLAQSMEIGYECVGETLTNVTFKNITVVHALHKPVISIHNAHNAQITNILYDGITIEDASMGGGDAGTNRQLIDITVAYSGTWSDQNHLLATNPDGSRKYVELGGVDGVTIKNVTVLSGGNNLSLRFMGSVDTRAGFGNSVHYVKNVTIENLVIKGVKITSGYEFITKTYATGIVIK